MGHWKCSARGFLWAAVLAFGIGGAASATNGNLLFVNGNKVNVRAGPSASDAVILQVVKGDKLKELQRQGEWVNVAIEAAGSMTVGWIHLSLVTKSDPAAVAVTKNTTYDYPQFETAVMAFSRRVHDDSGVRLYTAVEHVDQGVVKVTVAEDWLGFSEANQRSHLDSLFDMWARVGGVRPPRTVLVVAQDGAEVMRKTR